MTASRYLRRAQATLLAGALGAGLGAATPARADDISADGAQQLEQQVHDWLAALLGPHADIGGPPLHVTAEADHYRLEFPFAGMFGATGVTVEADPITADLKPLDGGRWALDDIRAPSPLHVSFPNAGAADSPATGQMTLTIAAQDQHAVFDPSLATASHWDAMLKGYTATTEGMKEGGTQTTSIDEMTMHLAWEPAADGRLNITDDQDSHLIASKTVMPDVGPVSFSIERMHGTLRFDGVAPDRVAPLLHAVMDLAPMGLARAKQQQAGAPDQKSLHELAEQNRAAAEADRQAAEADKQAVTQGRMTPAQRKKNTEERLARAKARRAAMLAAKTQPAAPAAAPMLSPEQHAEVHDALVALADLISGFDEQGTLENLHVVAAGHSGRLQKFALGLSVGAPDGKMAVRLNLAMDGLDSPDIPAGVFRDYLPRHLSITPRLSGVPSADLRDLLLRAADSNGNDPLLEVQAQALLDKGPVAAGFDELSFDFGPATLQGKGEVRILGTDRYEGEAHFTATGLDDLIKKANTVPELAQAAPVLFLVKGMGRQDGPNTVWDITYKDNKVLVNGNDLSQMLPGAK